MIEVRTEVAGIVCKVVAVTGDAISEHDTVIIVESMKMEIPIAAPASGVVLEIPVAEGEAVAEGTVVARIQG